MSTLRNLLLASLLLLVFSLCQPALAQVDRPAVPTHKNPIIQGVQELINARVAEHAERLQKIATPAELQAELAAARQRYVEQLGLPVDEPRAAPMVERVGEIDAGDYRIEKIILHTAPGVPTPCHVYVSKQGPARRPALLVAHGHGGRDYAGYQNAYQRLARAGFLVLAKAGWGKHERRATGHTTEGGQLMLSGSSLMALELWDNLRCVDYLLSRDDVEPEQLGMVGTSGGGSQTLFAAAIDPRIKAASPTCAVTSLQADLADTDMCNCELLPDLLRVGDHSLFLAMTFPRPVLVVNATLDYIFPIAGARASVAEASRLYALGGQPEGMRLIEFDAGHSWGDEMINAQISFFRAAFKLPPLRQLPVIDQVRAHRELNCFPAGELPDAGLTITEFNRRRIEQALGPISKNKPRQSLAEDRRWLKDWVRRQSSGPPEAPAAVRRSDWQPDRRNVIETKRLSWPSGLGGTVSLQITRPLAPADAKAARRHCVVSIPGDRPVDALTRNYWNDQLRAGAVVAELASTGQQEMNVHEEGQVATALISIGRSLLAERVRDLLVALTVLQAERLTDDDATLTIVAGDYNATLLLVAGSLLPEDARIVLDHPRVTYRLGADIDYTSAENGAETVHWSIVPDLARRTDLVDLLELAAPRSVLLLQPQDSAHQPLDAADWQRLSSTLARGDRRQLTTLTSDASAAQRLRKLVETALAP